jgi:type IV secretory pathway TraG/TraD family ATPase VirD4
MSVRIATAEWADPALVEQAYEYRPGTSWLGRSATDKDVPLGYGDDRHVCLVSGSRGGKGASSIVNNLILWPGSLVCVDPKGENATICCARRGQGSEYSKGLGQTVRVLDPFHAAQIDDSFRGHFNPLDTLDPDNEETIDEAGRIADAIVVIHEGGTNDPYWDESARSMVKGLLLHVMTAPEYEGARNLLTVRRLIMRGDCDAIERLRQDGVVDLPSAHAMLWTALRNNPAFDGLIAGIGDTFANMYANSDKGYESVLQVANRNTEFIDSPAMQRCLQTSDFQLSDLKTDPAGLSIFLCLPQRYMSTHYRWLRMMISLTVTEMEKVRGRPAAGYPILMLLDEFAGLKRMEIIESAVAQIAGFGVKMFFVLQTLDQLKSVYKDNWETFLANCGLKIFFNLEDNFSRDYVAKMIGETEVLREVRTASEAKSESESFSQSTTRSRSETKGTSTSTGTSVTDGTNSSVSQGQSWGISKSKGKSWNWSTSEKWTPGLIFRHYEPGVTEGKSESLSTNTTKFARRSSGTALNSAEEGKRHSRQDARQHQRSSARIQGQCNAAPCGRASAARTAGC